VEISAGFQQLRREFHPTALDSKLILALVVFFLSTIKNFNGDSSFRASSGTPRILSCRLHQYGRGI